MTVTYTAQVATSSFSCFLKLLAKWRGSIYKLLWKDFAVFAGIYFLLSFIYRFVLDQEQQRIFELIARYCEANNSLIPVAFVLGFFITLVVNRWWNQLMKIPWPDRMAMFITASIEGLDERGRLMRRTIMRYFCLSYVITMSSISPVVRKRFPTFRHMVDSGFLLENELAVLEGISTPHNKYFVPLAWAMTLVKRARSEKRIKDDFAVKTLNDEINEYRGCLGTLFLYDWVTIPLVYTQVVTLACYMFFFSCLMGRQFLKDQADMFFPIFTFLQYFFYMGWLKVAECLINPFGEDDEDFDVNSLIDRNLQVSYLIVDEMHNEHPELIKDQYWDDVIFNLPYTVASEPFRIPVIHLGSAMNINLSSRDKESVYPMTAIDEETRNNSLVIADLDSETNSEKPMHKPFRINSITSSIKSGRTSGLITSWRNRRASKQVSPKLPTDLSRHGRLSVQSSTSSVGGPNPQGPTTPNSQNEYIFQMSDVESDPEEEEEGVLIDVPSPPVSPHPPKIIYAKTFNTKPVRPKFHIERVSMSGSEMDEVSDDPHKDRTSLLGTRGTDFDAKQGDDPTMAPSYTCDLPTIEEARASVSDSLEAADSGRTPPKTNEHEA